MERSKPDPVLAIELRLAVDPDPARSRVPVERTGLLFGDTALVFTSAEKLWKRRRVSTALQWNWGGPQAQRRPEI